MVTARAQQVTHSNSRFPHTRLQQALSGSAGIEGVQWVVSGRALRSAIRQTLAGMLDSPSDLGPVVLRRTKFKPGRKLTAYYDVDLSAHGVRPRSIAVTWQPEGTHNLSQLSEAETGLEAEALASGVAAPFSRLGAIDPQLGMKMLIAPLDGAFPQLVRVSNPVHVGSRLPQMTDEDGVQESPNVQVTAVRYRPGQRHVLRYDYAHFDGRSQTSGTLFAKLYSDGEDVTAFRVASSIADWISTSTEAASIRPSAHLAEDGLVVYPKLSGVPLSQYSAARAARPLAQAGAVLRELQKAPVELFEDVRPHSFSKEVRAVARAGEHVEPLLPAAGAALDRILARVSAVEAEIEVDPPVLAHGDYKADHVWVGRRGITLIDFNTCSLADPALDVGKFLADLHWWYSGVGEDSLLSAQGSFLEGYGDMAPTRLLRARLYEVLILAKLTVRRVRLFDRRWAEKTERLLQRAERLAGQLEKAVRASSTGRAAPSVRARRE
jgi:Phosphotransferase enzyme family